MSQEKRGKFAMRLGLGSGVFGVVLVVAGCSSSDVGSEVDSNVDSAMDSTVDLVDSGVDSGDSEVDSGDVPPTPSSAPVLSAGHWSTCYTTPERTRCWGELPLFEDDPFTPFVVEGLTGATQVAHDGYFHLCAILADGSVGCWGRNRSGQLGREPEDALLPFERVVGVSEAVALDVGHGFTCAVVADGGVYCWGANAQGQLGRPVAAHRIGAEVAEPVPQRVADLPPATDVACGSAHACARLADGTVRCWGAGGSGELGQERAIDENGEWSMHAPVNPMLSDVKTIRTTSESTCALLDDGTVHCWGRYEFGIDLVEAPDRCTNGIVCLLTPRRLPGIDGLTELQIGGRYVCGQKQGGELVCFGPGSGPGTPSLGEASPPPFTQFALGRRHLCVLTPDRRVLCMGDGTHGQFGPETDWQDDFVELVRP